MNYKSDPSKPS
jgi:hypothetical protein